MPETTLSIALSELEAHPYTFATWNCHSLAAAALNAADAPRGTIARMFGGHCVASTALSMFVSGTA